MANGLLKAFVTMRNLAAVTLLSLSPLATTVAPPPPSDLPGTIVATAVGGGRCEFALDGRVQAKGTSVKIVEVALGPHVVSCRPSSGGPLLSVTTDVSPGAWFSPDFKVMK